MIRRKIPIYLALLAALLSLGGCGRERGTMIELTLDRTESSTAELTLSDGRALIDVGDSWGINGLNARLTEGQWPEEVTVHLAVRGLERLEVHYNNYTITTGRSSNDNPDPPLVLYVTNADGSVDSAPVSSSVYFPDIERTADGFSITLPPHFHHESPPSFSLQWIDFYR